MSESRYDKTQLFDSYVTESRLESVLKSVRGQVVFAFEGLVRLIRGEYGLVEQMVSALYTAVNSFTDHDLLNAFSEIVQQWAPAKAT